MHWNGMPPCDKLQTGQFPEIAAKIKIAFNTPMPVQGPALCFPTGLPSSKNNWECQTAQKALLWIAQTSLSLTLVLLRCHFPPCFSASFLFSRHSSIPLCSPCAQSEAGVATVSLMSNPLTLGEHCIAALMQGWILECGAWREAYRIRKKEKGKRKKELRRERSQNHTWDRRKKRGLGDNIRLHWRVRRIKLQSSLLNVCWDKKSLIWMEVVQVQAHCGMQ